MAVVIDSWTRLNELANSLDVGDGFSTPYVFRGHEAASHRLESTLHRAATLDDKRDLPGADILLR